MAKKRYYVALANGASIIVNGWCDPQLGTHLALLPAWARTEYEKCMGMGTQPAAPPASRAPASGNPALSLSQRSGGVTAASGAAALGAQSVNPAGAPDAVDLNVPLVGPGGKGFRLSASEERLLLPRRESLFRGVDTQAPETHLSQGVSPNSINFDSFRVPGSLSLRDGLVKISDDVDTLSPTNTIGLGLVGLVANDPTTTTSALLLLAFGDAQLSTAPSSGDVSWAVTKSSPMGRGIIDARDRKGPTITLTPGGSGQLTVTVVGWSGSDEYQVESDSIVAFSIVASTEGYPTDPEGSRSDRNAAVIANRTRWDGYANATAVATLDPGVYFVTVWAWTYTGRTAPTHKKVTVT